MAVLEEDVEKKGVTAVEPAGEHRIPPAYEDVAVGSAPEISPLKRSLQGRHMQMIAIGMSFVDSSVKGSSWLMYALSRWFHWCWSVRRYW